MRRLRILRRRKRISLSLPLSSRRSGGDPSQVLRASRVRSSSPSFVDAGLRPALRGNRRFGQELDSLLRQDRVREIDPGVRDPRRVAQAPGRDFRARFLLSLASSQTFGASFRRRTIRANDRVGARSGTCSVRRFSRRRSEAGLVRGADRARIDQASLRPAQTVNYYDRIDSEFV